MKRLIVIFFVFIAIGCDKNEKNLIRNWTLDRLVNDANGAEVADGKTKVTFNEDGTYKVSTSSKTLYYFADDNKIYFGKDNTELGNDYHATNKKLVIHGLIPSDVSVDPALNHGITSYLSR